MTPGGAPCAARDEGTPTVPASTTGGAPPAPAASLRAAVRASLIGYCATLAPLVAALVALEAGWVRSGAASWPAALAVVAGWSLAVAAWLRRRRWPAAAVDIVVWSPAVVLAGSLWLGWLSPAGLVLWGPASTVITVALTLSARPPTMDDRPWPGAAWRGWPHGHDRCQVPPDADVGAHEIRHMCEAGTAVADRRSPTAA